MKNILKRTLAYVIDVMFVTLIANLLSNTPLNPNYEKIEDLNTEYLEVYNYYNNAVLNIEKLIEEEKNEENINSFNETYKEYSENILKIYEDEKFEESEKEDILGKIQSDYSEKYQTFFYDMKKLSLYESIFLIIIMLLYFVGFTYIMNGETLGKKIMKLRIVSCNNKKLKIYNYFIRTLIIYGLIITIADIILFYTLQESIYMNFYNYTYLASYALEFSIILTSYINSEHRGIHDILSGTKVIDLKIKEINIFDKKNEPKATFEISKIKNTKKKKGEKNE